MLNPESNNDIEDADEVNGEFLTVAGERYYAIRNVDQMAPFLISVISSANHWLFASSTGGLTAGRVSPDSALFPYVTVDKIHESVPHTGSKTIIRIDAAQSSDLWEPFEPAQSSRFEISRHLYKNILGDKLCFEEINHDLQIAFRYTWVSSDEFGFVRQCQLQNLGDQQRSVEVVDGLQNVLPAGTPRIAQTNSSNLVNAYKWAELDESSGLAMYALYSGVSDRAEPRESLRANTIFCLGIADHKTLLCSSQLDDFRAGRPLQQEERRRGVRGAYFVNLPLTLEPQATQNWQIVADVEKSQSEVVELRRQLTQRRVIAKDLERSIDQGTDSLARIMAAADGFQSTAEENVSAHHYANVLFNVLRGGTFDDQYQVSAANFAASTSKFNNGVYRRNEQLFKDLPDRLDINSLLTAVQDNSDPQLERLGQDYLPITFGRRHGDPSRPWNNFAIKLRDNDGKRLLSYEGNWRDIFQNWEALAFSYPDFVENIVAKFVNASTMDGYNPYRITDGGIDWEVEDPRDPWSYIGYWGDHQIIYLQKLLELSRKFHPARLSGLLRKTIFSYANVPYRIKPFESLLDNPKSTVSYDFDVAELIKDRVTRMGSDGKLVLDANDEVYQVNLLEKLLVPLLGKLGNLVIDGGVWLNTQRPEWNDANNALVGNGLSMVTLYYMRRYVRFLQQLLTEEFEPIEISVEVREWLIDTANALSKVRSALGPSPITPGQRYETLRELGDAASRYRDAIYRAEPISGKRLVPLDSITDMLDAALTAIDHSIATNRRDDGLYHAYNLMDVRSDGLHLEALYPMLEGQVAALSGGTIGAEEACDLLEALFASAIFRPDQNSFMLYPDRQMLGFLEKNNVPAEDVEQIPLLQQMLSQDDERILCRDVEGCYRFNADFSNFGDLSRRLDSLKSHYGADVESARESLQNLYEKVFNHRAFTGRSGGMFGFEGLGCIYWHMVSKLLLAVQEIFFSALDKGADRQKTQHLGHLYYRVRDGLGFNKTPSEYGAFPVDPYSHTPKHAGARQPGMTGQVKEEILSRFGELGLRVREAALHFDPSLLRLREFPTEPGSFRYLDVCGDWQELELPKNSLAFTWCQVPIVYQLSNESDPRLSITWANGEVESGCQLTLTVAQSSEIFLRTANIRQLTLLLNADALFAE